MATWLEKLRKIDAKTKEQEKLAREMTHVTRPDIESLRGQDPLTDWGLGVRERTLNPLSTLAGEAKRFQGLSPEEMGMELVGGGMAGTIGKSAELFRGLREANNPLRTNPIDWFSETEELAKKYGDNLITKILPEKTNLADLGFRDYMTEVKKDDVLDRVKRSVIDSFDSGKIDRETALNNFNKINDMYSESGYKRAHEWINTKEISNILQDSGYNAISHIENGNQTYGFLNRLNK